MSLAAIVIGALAFVVSVVALVNTVKARQAAERSATAAVESAEAAKSTAANDTERIERERAAHAAEVEWRRAEEAASLAASISVSCVMREPNRFGLHVENLGPAAAQGVGVQIAAAVGGSRPWRQVGNPVRRDLKPGQSYGEPVSVALGMARTVEVIVYWTDGRGPQSEQQQVSLP